MDNTERERERERERETRNTPERETHTKLVIKKRHAVLLSMKQ